MRTSLLVDPTHLPQIFKDLAEIVNDQQEDINTVEAMIEKSHAHARSGLDQVEKVQPQHAREPPHRRRRRHRRRLGIVGFC